MSANVGSRTFELHTILPLACGVRQVYDRIFRGHVRETCAITIGQEA